MLLRLFKNNRTGGILFLLVLGILIWFPLLSQDVNIPVYRDMPLYNLLLGNLNEFPVMSAILAFVLIAVMAIMLFRLNIRFFLIQERTFMPASFFLIISSASPAMHHISPILIGSFFLLLVLVSIFGAYNSEENSLSFFNAALLFALGTLFYGKLLWFIPLLWIILLTIRKPGWREFLFTPVALFITFLFLFTFYLMTGDLDKLGIIPESLRIEGTWPDLQLSWSVFIAYLFFLIIIASLFILQRYQVRKIYVRNFYQALFFTFIYSLAFFLLVSGFEIRSIYFMAIPLSYLLANYFHSKKNRFTGELMLALLLGLVVWVQWNYLFP
ncbi:MAG: hypothetical protein ACOYXB_06300 [Bacteroidota bacterium]